MGSYAKADYTSKLRPGRDLILKFGLAHFNRFSYDTETGAISFIDANPRYYDLYRRPFYREAERALGMMSANGTRSHTHTNVSHVWLDFESEKGDARRAVALPWRHGIVLASVERS